MTSGARTSAKSGARGSGPWISLVLGAAVLAGVVVAATHFAEEEAFVRLVREAKPWWFVAALLLQAGTYLAQGGI
jgi:uncharacterized membrane protein